MIHLLIPLHIFRSFNAHAQVCPVEVPTAVLGDLFHAETSRHTSHHVVLAVARAYRQVSTIESKTKKGTRIRDNFLGATILPPFLLFLRLDRCSIFSRFHVGVRK